jgi:hypothetical protein
VLKSSSQPLCEVENKFYYDVPFVCVLFDDAVSSSDYMLSDDKMNNG